MPCLFCTSDNQTAFLAEIDIFFPGLINAGKDPLLVFPQVLVCLDCGFSSFTTPASELSVLAKARAQHTDRSPDPTESNDPTLAAP